MFECVCGYVKLLILLMILASCGTASMQHDDFTGDVIFPLYVSDVQRSAKFYQEVLGFEFLGFYDYERNIYVRDWKDTSPPIYAGFVAGDQKFGLHKPMNADQERSVGCGRFYFRVRDLEKCRHRIRALGRASDGVIESHLLRMFHVTDPDGRKIFFAETREGASLDPW